MKDAIVAGSLVVPVTESRSAAEAAAREREELAWFERMRTGDEAAFELLFRAYAGPLAAFAYSFVDSQSTAQEIVQDLFCRLWQRRETLEVPRSIYSYLFGATRNRAINYLRNRRVQNAFLARVLHSNQRKDLSRSAPQEGALDARALAEAVERAVRELPERCRDVFVLTRNQHLSYAQVAETLHISPKTVEIHMGRALALLRQKLAPWMG